MIHFLRAYNDGDQPLPKIKIYFFLLSIFVDELISTPKVITFLPNPVPENEKLSCLSNPIPYPEYLHLSISAFLVKLTTPNKQSSSVRQSLMLMLLLIS